MSRKSINKITCPKCGKESECVIWNSINTETDPEMKIKVRSGEAFRWTCPECGYQTYLNYSTLYHQMEDHAMIFYVPGDKTEAVKLMEEFRRGECFREANPELKLEEDYRIRIVGSRPAFREKIMILDAGLDDRVIEIMKRLLMASLHYQNPDLDAEEMLFNMTAEGKKVFLVHIAGGKWRAASYSQKMYDSIAKDYKELIDSCAEVIIDENWAASMIESKS